MSVSKNALIARYGWTVSGQEGGVSSVNGIGPDPFGNVELTATSITPVTTAVRGKGNILNLSQNRQQGEWTNVVDGGEFG